MENPNIEAQSCSVHSWYKVKADLLELWLLTKQLVQDDPRRVVHCVKLGLAITLVSLFYYFDPLYEGFGVNAMWAVLTVVVVFEYSVGATLGKGVNRAIATILGCMCGVGAHRLAGLSGEKLEPALLGFSVFLVAAITTFIRFYPKMKARFDYGLVIFILTFSLICVSGYRDDEVLDMSHRRVTTILIGSSTTVLICMVIWPVWAGADLHELVASNIEKLGDFFEAFGADCFKSATPGNKTEVTLSGYRSVLDSKGNIDSLINFALWEPRHGRFKHRHPWKQYQKIGALTRRCAYRAEALHSYLHCQTQAPKEVKSKFQEPCIKMSTESGKALKELSVAITIMIQPSQAKPHIQSAKQAAQNLNLLLKSNIWSCLTLSDVTQGTTVASLLADVVKCVEEIHEAVQELASQANFKPATDTKLAQEMNRRKLANQGSIKRRSFINHVIMIEGSTPSSSPRYVSFQDPPSLAMSQVAE